MTRGSLPPGSPPSLVSAYNSLTSDRRAAFHDHLTGGTSADYLSDWLKRAGHQVSATTIRTFRKKVSA